MKFNSITCPATLKSWWKYVLEADRIVLWALNFLSCMIMVTSQNNPWFRCSFIDFSTAAEYCVSVADISFRLGMSVENKKIEIWIKLLNAHERPVNYNKLTCNIPLDASTTRVSEEFSYPVSVLTVSYYWPTKQSVDKQSKNFGRVSLTWNTWLVLFSALLYVTNTLVSSVQIYDNLILQKSNACMTVIISFVFLIVLEMCCFKLS